MIETRSWVAVVAVAEGDGVVLERIEIDGDADRRADLVLAAVALADVAVVVPHDARHDFLEHHIDLARFRDEFRLVLEKRKTAALIGATALLNFKYVRGSHRRARLRVYADARMARMVRSTPKEGSMTCGMNRSPV